MATRIKFKRSETGGSIPDSSDLDVGEVAINTIDQTLWVRATDIPGGGGGDQPVGPDIPQIIEVANKGQTADEVTTTTTVMSIALSQEEKMATRIKVKRSESPGAVPDTNNLAVGEVALNTADQKLYVRDSSNQIVVVATKGQTAAEVTAKAAVMAIALG